MSFDTTSSWSSSEAKSPHIAQPVPVIVGRDIPYLPQAHRFQTLSIYLPHNAINRSLLDTAISSIPKNGRRPPFPTIYVHVHGGAFRDANLTSASIEATVAHAFSSSDNVPAFSAIVSINYTLTHFPTHPTQPYDSATGNHSDPSREAVHPAHICDILQAFAFLRRLGLQDDGYVLSGHSAGACLAFQATLQDPGHWGHGADNLPSPPRPAALIGMNGLYDLPNLVHGLGVSHAWLEGEYRLLLGNAFGKDEGKWIAASPARFEIGPIGQRAKEGKAPKLVLVDQSSEDQLVPMNQAAVMEALLEKVDGLAVVRGKRCHGNHAAPWEQGYMIWQELQDVVGLLDRSNDGNEPTDGQVHEGY